MDSGGVIFKIMELVMVEIDGYINVQILSMLHP